MSGEQLIGPEHQRRLLAELAALKSRVLDLERALGASSIKLGETSSAPSTADVPDNAAFVYAVDNGSGKTSLRVQFSTGAAQTLATEP
jgi:hypothetical protein